MNGRPAFILLDANNFYVGVERVWRPELANKPVVVAGSGDGCVIARSDEAKAIGIKMGDPLHLVRQQHWRSGLIICSANFPLYGDASSRLMRSVATVAPKITPYSIDECFIHAHGMSDQQLHQLAIQARERVLAWTGLGTGAGIGPTPTLAKLGSYGAKRVLKTGLCNLMSPFDREQLMALAPVGEVWGIGPSLTARLAAMGVTTAAQFAKLPRHVVEREFPVTVLRTQLELNGICAVDLQGNDGPREMINVSRSFGSRIESLDALIAALVEFASMASARLRKQGSAASAIRVYARTSPFETKSAPYAKTVTVPFAQPAFDARVFARAASQAARSIFKPGIRFSKAGVLLMGIQPADAMNQQDLFGYDDTSQDRLMSTLDEINSRFGRGTVKLARTMELGGSRARPESLSPAYSCRLADLKVVF